MFQLVVKILNLVGVLGLEQLHGSEILGKLLDGRLRLVYLEDLCEVGTFDELLRKLRLAHTHQLVTCVMELPNQRAGGSGGLSISFRRRGLQS